MRLTRLTIHGFKSFADRVELMLEPGLTGIVGPNGCGKSNIVDALRWISGEGSARGVRGEDMDDVIFAGAGSRSARDVAEVAVQVEGDLQDYARHVTDGAAELRRSILRGQGSTYRIGGREVRAKDVQRLFQDAGAGARGTAIVAQGQIQAVIEAKPEERRRLLEEAAGVGGLQSRKREAEGKLIQTEANLARIDDLIRAEELRVGQLVRQAAQAERFKKVAAELREAELALAAARLAEARAKLEAASIRLRATNDALAEAERTHRDALDRLGRAEAAETGAREARARLEASHAALTERGLARRAAAERATIELAELTERRDRLQAELADAGGRHAELLAERGRLDGEQVAAEERRAELAGLLPRLVEQLGDARTALAAAEAEALAARERRFEAEAAFARAREADHAATQAETALADRRQRLATRLDTLIVPEGDPALDRARADAVRLRNELAAAEAALPGQRQEAADAGIALARLEAELAAAAAAMPAIERRVSETGERRQRLEARRAAQASRADALAERLARLGRDRAALGRRDEAGLARQAAGLVAARAALGDREGQLARAREVTDGAERALAEVAAVCAAAQARLDQLRRERDELAGLLPPIRPDEVIGRIGVSAELAPALAAALGEGLTASLDPKAPRHWADAPAGPDGPAMPGLPSLLERVDVPAVLRPALARVWLVDAAEAPRRQPGLPPGGALVSPDGGLWRWDGYVRLPGATDAAAIVLAQRDRLQRLATRIAAEEPVLAERTGARDTAAADVTRARAALAAAEAAVGQGRAELDAAERAHALALAEDERWQRRSAELGALAERVEAERVALAADQGEIDAEAATLADLAALRGELQAARDRQGAAAAELRAQGDVLGRARRGQEAAEAAVRHRRDDLAASEGEVARLDAAFLEKRTTMAVERAAAEAELARLATGLGEAAEARLAAAAVLAERAGELEAARGRALAGERLLAQARDTAVLAERRVAEARNGLELVTARLAGHEEQARRLAEELARLVAEQAARQARSHELAQRLVQAGPAAERLGGEAAALAASLEADRAGLADAGAGLAAAERAHAAERARAAEAERAERQAAERAAEARAGRQAQAEALAALKELAGRFDGQGWQQAVDGKVGIAELEERVRRLRAGRDRLGAVNLLAADEAAAAGAELDRLKAERTELAEAAARLIKAVRSLDQEARQRLLDQFATIERHFAELFARLFGGGTAQVRLTSPDDPLIGGLELEASPPGKRLSSLSLLSGGEKALTAACLIFAFFLARPSPLCVLDEVDAPLDDANVGRLVDLIQEIAGRTGTRFLVVTHHALTMARMDRLYGVTMVERGVSRLVSVELGRALALRRTA